MGDTESGQRTFIDNDSPDGEIDIATLVRRALAEVCTVPVLLVHACWLGGWSLTSLFSRVVVSFSTSRSRDGLETYQRLVSVSSRRKLSTSRSRLGLGH